MPVFRLEKQEKRFNFHSFFDICNVCILLILQNFKKNILKKYFLKELKKEELRNIVKNYIVW